jgi:hypothetical protein
VGGTLKRTLSEFCGDTRRRTDGTRARTAAGIFRDLAELNGGLRWVTPSQDDEATRRQVFRPQRGPTTTSWHRAPSGPFGSGPGKLCELFETASARTPEWHEERADALDACARAHPNAAVANAYRRIAARHRATAHALLVPEPAAVPKPGRLVWAAPRPTSGAPLSHGS